jgi:hypothetical protein
MEEGLLSKRFISNLSREKEEHSNDKMRNGHYCEALNFSVSSDNRY